MLVACVTCLQCEALQVKLQVESMVENAYELASPAKKRKLSAILDMADTDPAEAFEMAGAAGLVPMSVGKKDAANAAVPSKVGEEEEEKKEEEEEADE
jgi:hypothetical protein